MIFPPSACPLAVSCPVIRQARPVFVPPLRGRWVRFQILATGLHCAPYVLCNSKGAGDTADLTMDEWPESNSNCLHVLHHGESQGTPEVQQTPLLDECHKRFAMLSRQLMAIFQAHAHVHVHVHVHARARAHAHDSHASE